MAVRGKGGVQGDAAGTAVAFVDMNRDGFADMVVGASRFDSNRGRVCVVFGKGGLAGQQASTLDVLSGANGFCLEGATSGDRLGVSVAAAGDVNSDGYPDLIVGADGRDEIGSNAGAAYVYFGRASHPATISVDDLSSGSIGFKIVGSVAGALLGTSVGGGGDFDGDGVEDLVVGAPGEGKAYVIYGSTAPFASIYTHNMSCADGLVLAHAERSFAFGQAVSSAGDFNADGKADVLIGAPDGGVDTREDAGFAYAIYGRASTCPGAEVSVPDDLDGSNGFGVLGYDAVGHLGFAVSAGGDVDGDGIGDIVLGAYGAAAAGVSGAGETYVLYGTRTALPSLFEAGTLHEANTNGTQGFVIRGTAPNEWSGYSVAGGSDVDGDGLSDIVVGAVRNGCGGANVGGAYVVYGVSDRSQRVGGVLDLGSASERAAAKFAGAREDGGAGTSVGAGGDVNGDGLGDVLVGSPDSTPGMASVVFGRDFKADAFAPDA
mmetsp:Transcript_14513/g.34384  ORF Transcript_14513/g.34384 Transcript_14513/m.34384 type:complete len:489 (+) Transcript_14513:2-1468(+)